MAMLLDLKLSLVFLMAAPLVALALYLVMSRSVPFYRTIQRKLDRISVITRENLSGVRVIRAFSKQEREQDRFDAACEELCDASMRVGRISALLNPLTYLIMNAAIVAILWFGGLRVDAGALTQGQIIAFVNYMTQISLALVVVANLVVIFTRASASASRINEIFALSPTVVEQEARPVTPVSGAPRVQFDHVSFAYTPGADEALSDVSFTIHQGQTVGVIGGTGAGKTTLVQLLMRFYDATAGRVLVDGVDVRAYPLSQLRGQIGVAPQRAVLVSGTLRDNLTWRKADATDAAIARALELSQAAEFVSTLPDGLNARIEQGGWNFSGGQRQRLTIARALVGDPSLLILDDSASALDYATDLKLRRALRQQMQGLTVLLISQRVSAIRHADLILVLDDGRLVGFGTHAQLLESCPVYQEICASQLKSGEVGA